MKVTLLGTGTPDLDPNRQHSAQILETNSEKILVDAGRGVTTQMLKVGIQPQDIDAVFITHHHYDHICDLGEFLMCAWHNGRKTPLPVYGPQGTSAIVASLFGGVFARDIAFARLTDPDNADIREWVQVTDISGGWIHDSIRWTVRAEYVEHGNSLGLLREVWPCLGYRFEADGKSIAISGDTVPCEGLDRLAQNVDVLIQCCYLADAEITTDASAQQAAYVIASSGQVGKIAARNQVKKLVLTHIAPKSDALLRSMLDDVRRDYNGEVVLGEDLLVIEV